MKRPTIWKVVAPLCLLGLLIGVGVAAKQKAKVEAPKSVKQGSNLVLNITTDIAANVSGNVNVQFSDSDGHMVSSGGYGLKGTTATVTYGMPLNAKTGTWRIVKISFEANGEDKDLTPEGDLTFKVSPHDPLVLPSRATVEIH